MLNLVSKNSIAALERQVTDKQNKLSQLRSQYGEVRGRVDALGDLVSSALVDGASNLQSLEGQLSAAESRLRSVQSAISKVEGEVSNLELKLAAEKDRVAREASAAHLRQLAKDLEKSKPVAAQASRRVAELWGSAPANVPFSALVLEGCNLWLGSAGFFEGDFLDLAIKTLRQHADLILSGEHSADLGRSFDEQAIAYGRPPIGLKKAS